jgi:predicted permease
MLRDLIRDLRHGARLLGRNPAFTTVVVTTLAMAIGATVTVFSIVDAWLFRPLNFPRADRLVIAFAARPDTPTEPAVWLPYRMYLGWKERSRSFSYIAGAFVRDVTLTTASDAQTILGLSVTPEFFETFGVPPLIGRTLSQGDAGGPRAVVLSYGLWQRRFGGSPDVIHQSVTLSSVPHTIVGVMPRDFDTRVLDMQFEFWTPFLPDQAEYQPGGTGPVALIGRLRDGVSIEDARAEAVALTRELESQYPRNFNAYIANVTSLQGDNTRNVRMTLLTIAAAVVSLLLIAAMNVGTLLVGRGITRMREAAIRAAVGSGRGRLVRQFLAESLLIALLGTAAGVALASVAMRLFIAWDPIGVLPANAIRFDTRVAAVTGIALLLTTTICGLIPALRVSQADPYDALRSGGERSGAAAPAQRAQLVMLAGQVAACVVLLATTALLTRTFLHLVSEPLGFDPEHVVVANVVLPTTAFDSGEKRFQFYTEVSERLRAQPGVRDVGMSTTRPLNSGVPSAVYLGPDDPPDAARISTQEVSAEFFDAMKMPLVAGRGFDGRDRRDRAPVVILNVRAAQRLFGDPSAALGRRLRLDQEPWREVIGVVGDVRSSFFNTLAWTHDPIVYRPAAQGLNRRPNPTLTAVSFQLHIRSASAFSIAAVREAAHSTNAAAAVTELRSVREMIAVATRQPAFRMTLLLGFAAMSVLLAAIGVYGVASQAVTTRVRELAIRVALGAEPRLLMAAAMRRVLVATIAGVIAGGALALMMSTTLEALLFGVEPRDALSFAAAGATLVMVTAIAAFLPARRAIRVDPVTTLRAE